MSDKEFVQWMRGFVEGVHHYSLSPKQWDYLKEKLKQVKTDSFDYKLSERWTSNTA